MDSLRLAAASNPVMEHPTKVLESLAPVNVPTPLKPPTFDGMNEVDIFIQQFKDVSVENKWREMKALVHLRSSLMEVSTSQAKEKLMHLKKDSHCAKYRHNTPP